MNVISEVKIIEKDIINWRRELHSIPEYGFELYKTTKFIQDKLNEFNINYRVAAKTGIIATIYGKNKGPTIAIRADMDALPINEETTLDFKSNNNYMHACGHDAHVAMLLGAAKILAKERDYITGNVRLIFQPAEETTGGAEIMIKEGCLDNPKVDYIIGLHIGTVFKQVKNGQIGVKFGEMMAAVDAYSGKVIGKGGHGALPNLCVDPILISAEILTSIQKIVSREIKPTHAAVITTGMINGGTDYNIIPQIVDFKGTVRTLSDEDRDFIEYRIKEIISKTAAANRALSEIEYNRYYPSLVNNRGITNKIIKTAKKIVDSNDIIEITEPALTAEDMSYYLKEIPGAFFILGSSKKAEDGIVYPHHHPKFDIDENVMWKGTAMFVQFIYDNLFQLK